MTTGTLEGVRRGEMQTPDADRACPHCGYRHHKWPSGTLKYYVGALQCPLYVALIAEEIGAWGAKTSSGLVDRRPTATGYVCTAPPEFSCVYKGGPASGIRGEIECGSTDGYPSSVEAAQKYKLDRDGEGLLEDHGLLCEYRCPRRRHTNPVTENSAPHHLAHGTFSAEATGNFAPGSYDWRRARVISEYERRVRRLQALGLRPTPARIARIGGFTAHAQPRPRRYS